MYFSDEILSKMHVKSRLTDMSKWGSTIRRACHALFLYELKGYRRVLFCWCYDPPRSPQILSAGQGPDRCPNWISGPRTRTPDRTSPNPSGFRGFRGVRTYRQPPFFFVESTLLARQLHQERTQMEAQ